MEASGPRATGERTALLQRFQPCLRYDSLESYFADSAVIWLANPHCRLSDGQGKTIASAVDELSCRFLRPDQYPNGRTVERSDFTESTRGDYARQYSKLREAQPEFRNVVYERSVESHARLWLQHWFFYYFNDYQLAWGIGVHEVGWEMIQLRMKPPVGEGAASEPDIAVYAQHNFCETRSWPDVRRLAAGRLHGDQRKAQLHRGRDEQDRHRGGHRRQSPRARGDLLPRSLEPLSGDDRRQPRHWHDRQRRPHEVARPLLRGGPNRSPSSVGGRAAGRCSSAPASLGCQLWPMWWSPSPRVP